MDKLVRKIEVPLAKAAVEKAGLYLVPKERLGELAEVAMDAYYDYPLHNWLSGGKYDPVASRMPTARSSTALPCGFRWDLPAAKRCPFCSTAASD